VNPPGPLVDTSVKHLEYRNKTITRLANGNSLYGCYALAATIFTLGIIRDFLCVSTPSPSPGLTHTH